MSAKLPPNVRLQVKSAVYERADEFRYAERNRVENNAFLNDLVKDPEIGLRISEFIPREKVRTYIKDGILNAYSKQRQAVLLCADPTVIAHQACGQNVEHIETTTIKSSKVHLFRREDNDYLVLVEGNVLKWETALRKALEFIARSPGLPPENHKVHLALNLASTGAPLTESDRKAIARALDFIGVNVIFLYTTDPGLY